MGLKSEQLMKDMLTGIMGVGTSLESTKYLPGYLEAAYKAIRVNELRDEVNATESASKDHQAEAAFPEDEVEEHIPSPSSSVDQLKPTSTNWFSPGKIFLFFLVTFLYIYFCPSLIPTEIRRPEPTCADVVVIQSFMVSFFFVLIREVTLGWFEDETPNQKLPARNENEKVDNTPQERGVKPGKHRTKRATPIISALDMWKYQEKMVEEMEVQFEKRVHEIEKKTEERMREEAQEKRKKRIESVKENIEYVKKQSIETKERAEKRINETKENADRRIKDADKRIQDIEDISEKRIRETKRTAEETIKKVREDAGKRIKEAEERAEKKAEQRFMMVVEEARARADAAERGREDALSRADSDLKARVEAERWKDELAKELVTTVSWLVEREKERKALSGAHETESTTQTGEKQEYVFVQEGQDQ
ncbi:hypothetical protein FQN54_000046 [Arachnomyces sp. PD_36]|nr:hypothetical protein FQN54_000046 [Arachnomyces sp. PD_36]